MFRVHDAEARLTPSRSNRMRRAPWRGATRLAIAACVLSLAVLAPWGAGVGCVVGPTTMRALPVEARTYLDIPYVEGGHERQVLDLFLPAAAEPTPLVIWVHGGGWNAGDKSRNPARRLVEQGYAVAGVNYRYSRHAIFPAQIHDVCAAVRFLRANHRKYNLNPDRFAAWGASAGGHLVALLGVAGDVPEIAGREGSYPGESSRVQAVIDWFGATELRKPDELPLNSNRIKLLGGRSEEKPELAALASPLAFVSPGDTPVLIMHGDRDGTVDLEHSRRFEQALRAAGVDVTLVVVEGAGHGGDKFYTPEMKRAVDAFLSRTIGR